MPLIYFVSHIFRTEVPHEYWEAPGSFTLLPTEHTHAPLANNILYTQHTHTHTHTHIDFSVRGIFKFKEKENITEDILNFT